jgi:hypothetical protein
MSLQLRTTVNLFPSGVILIEIRTSFLWVVLACFAVFGWRLSVMGVLVLASFCFPPRRNLGRCGVVDGFGLGKAAGYVFLGLKMRF